ncbi:MAG: bifunctional tRNA (5-methylaminomethyl-2-thiouridine)(34)-methyltransferase MnmD/FAD-dependent 5-carboxymethylaminomethyl-2-thiouridine(34) oxidoreductase MnmC [Gammaproteobacteria bacterium]|nr:bifunctional tRNA (5-methylaminomethyl-2-thiouridine)(34)-methyltransferase MnmD/FAD-dependent 5-carboxymethylaminomethyl-2-thiouridine(34) oxidoreductase MnmC [Gammaproteobacteria bacterium]
MQYTNLIWRDGHPYSELFDDIYYSSDNTAAIPGESEFNHVFFEHNNLAARWQEREHFVIAELGFGSGLNCVLTIRQWLKHCAACHTKKTLHYIAIDKYPLSADSVAALVARYPELKPVCDEMLDSYPPAVEATHCRKLFDNQVVIHYKFMGIKQALDDEALAVDAWYLDGFSPAKNPDMWTSSVFEQMALNSAAGASCSTYTSAGFVRRNLEQAGFEVRKVSGHGNKREMLAASLKDRLCAPLCYKDKPWFVPAKKIICASKNMTIIGAGVAGLTMAYSMVQRGWSVRIIDRHRDIAAETSSNPAAIIYPRLSVNNETDTRFYVAAYCYALHVLNKLQRKHRQAFWFDEGLSQAFDRNRITAILHHFQFNKDFMSIAECFLRGDTRQPDDRVFVDYRKAGVVLPSVLCEVIRQACGDALQLLHGAVDEISYGNNKWSCFSGAELIDEADCLVIANGVSVNDLLVKQPLPVAAIRGQALILNTNQGSENIQKTINADIYFTHSIAGKHYLGGTYSRSSKTTKIDLDDNRSLLASLDAIYPGAFGIEDIDESWAGFRCMSKDRVPVVGAVPDAEFFHDHYADIHHGRHNKRYPAAQYQTGLYITAAHGSRGFTGCFLSAEIIASQIEGEPVPVNKKTLDYLSPSRFIVNELKRRRFFVITE